MTPAPEPELEPVFQPLKTVWLWAPISLAPGTAAAGAKIRALRSRAGLTVDVKKCTGVPALHSSDTFGHRSRLVPPGVHWRSISSDQVAP